MREKAVQEAMPGAIRVTARHPSLITRKAQPVTLADSLLSLQRTHGNRFVQQAIRSKLIQAKLSIGEPGDVYEMEADRVADQVMRMPEPATHNTEELPGQNNGLGIQRLDKERLERVQKQASAQVKEEEEEEPVIQAKEAPGQSLSVTDGLESEIRSLNGGGPLAESARSFFEPRFGYDFSGVRIHNDSRAASLARSINAQAFTIGQNMVFGEGQYQPNSPEGQRLLAHELTHVVQQNDQVQRKTRADSGREEMSHPRRAAYEGAGLFGDIRRRDTAPKIQRRLVTFGTLADVNALLGLIGPRAGLTLTLNVANNQVRITAVLPGTPPSAALRTQLTTIINDATHHAEVIIARGQPQVQVGAFPQPTDMTVTKVQQIDIDDILAIEAGAAGNGAAKAAHEIQENFQAHLATPVAGVDRFSSAHDRGVDAENAVTAQLVGPGRRDGGVEVTVSPTVQIVIQDFENYYLVFTATTTAATQNVVISAARRAAPVVISGRTIDQFVSGSSTVPAAGAATITAAAADVAANPNSTVMIEGFSDSGGAAAANLTASRQRAEQVRTALIAAGVRQGRTRIEPRGAVNFVAANDNDAHRALNRRVVITVRRPGP
jgi:outer membrane protein OmpA-like peptidoglycan-associated protein